MSSHNYHIAAEADIKPKANRHIWVYLVLLAVGLFLTIWGLIIMFSFQLDQEKEQKIGMIYSAEMLDQKAMSEAYLSGKLGIVPDKKHVAIAEAVAKFLVDTRRGR